VTASKALLPLLVALLALGARADGRAQVVFDEPSAYGRVLVLDDGTVRTLVFDDPDGGVQSAMRVDRPGALELEYVRYALVGLTLVGEAPRVLMIGLGGGSFSGFVHRNLPGAQVTVVEINPVVVKAAKKLFGVVEDARHRIVTGDGRAFLEASADLYDLVFVDAYSGDGIPDALRGPAFLSLVRRHVGAGGIAVFNLALDRREERRFAAEVADAFGQLVCLRTPVDGNLLVIGPRATPPQRSVIVERAEALTRARKLPIELAPLARAARVGDAQRCVER
jgi:spermidine synthase